MYSEDDGDFEMYKNFYLVQQGNGLAHYSGVYVPRQTGEGIGNFLKTAGSALKPLLLSGAKALGKNLLKSGVGLVEDVIGGKSFKSAAVGRLKEGGKNLFMDLVNNNNSRKRKARTSTAGAKQKTGKASNRGTKRQKRTIFDR